MTSRRGWRVKAAHPVQSSEPRNRPRASVAHGHTWHSAAGRRLVCFDRAAARARPRIAAADHAGSGARDARRHRRCHRTRADLRWPNDVLLGEKKCAGILAQWKATPSSPGSASTSASQLSAGDRETLGDFAAARRRVRLARRVAGRIGGCRRRLLRRAHAARPGGDLQSVRDSLPLTCTDGAFGSTKTA